MEGMRLEVEYYDPYLMPDQKQTLSFNMRLILKLADSEICRILLQPAPKADYWSTIIKRCNDKNVYSTCHSSASSEGLMIYVEQWVEGQASKDVGFRLMYGEGNGETITRHYEMKITLPSYACIGAFEKALILTTELQRFSKESRKQIDSNIEQRLREREIINPPK